MALISLISSFIGVFCCIGVDRGHRAGHHRARTRSSGPAQDGYGLAVAGIVIGVARLLVYLVIVIFACIRASEAARPRAAADPHAAA